MEKQRSQQSAYVVFGYGSLIFKPPPHTVRQDPGFLKGYVRRFAQKSHDHRGTPENPGRVVTLVHKEDWDLFSKNDPFPDEDAVWGIAYTIDPVYAADVRDYLDYREKDGYTLEVLDIYGLVNGHETVIIHDAFCYVGRPDNSSFIGSEPIDQLADRIWRSVGPSGPNKEYFYRLADSVRHLAPESRDSHLIALETRIRALDEEHGIKDNTTQHTQVQEPYVVFGYGSLVFKPPPYVIAQVPGYLKGYVRRFSQMSHYHRGTPENPGRAVTLIHKEDWDNYSSAQDPFPEEDTVWGIAYTIDPLHASGVRDYMNFREKDGYTLEKLDIYAIVDGKEAVVVHECEVFVGHSNNPSFTGYEPLEDLAYHIWKTSGPSGPNKEYVYKLAKAVREMAPEARDAHLFALEKLITVLDREHGDYDLTKSPKQIKPTLQ